MRLFSLLSSRAHTDDESLGDVDDSLLIDCQPLVPIDDSTYVHYEKLESVRRFLLFHSYYIDCCSLGFPLANKPVPSLELYVVLN